MIAAFLSARNGQWRYDIGADSWSTITPRAAFTEISPFDGGTSFGVLGPYAYAFLEDGRLYRAAFVPGDLVWEGPLAAGWSFLGLPRTFAAHAYQMADVAGDLWIYGADHQILLYAPDDDAVLTTLTVPSPIPAADLTNVGLVWDHADRVYALEGSGYDGRRAAYVYDLTTETWSPVGDGIGPDTLRPLSSLWWDGTVASMNAFGTLARYDPATDAWATVDMESRAAFGGWLGRIDDATLLVCAPQPLAPPRLFTYRGDGTFADLARAPAVPAGNGAMSFFNLYVLPPVLPIPLSVFPTDIALPKQFEMVQVPRVRGAVAVESTYQTPVATFRGILATETEDDMRALIEATLTWLQSGPIQVEILPGRVCTAYVHEHTLDPKWPGVNGTLMEFSFSVRIPDTLFYSYDGYGYHSP